MTLFTIAQYNGFHLNAKPAKVQEAMGGEYIPNKPAMNYCFWRNI